MRKFDDVEEVGSTPCHQLARAGLVVEGKTQLLHMRKDVVAHIGLDVNAEQMPVVGHDIITHGANDMHEYRRRDNQNERAQMLRPGKYKVVQRAPCHERIENINCGDNERAEHIKHEKRNMPSIIARKAPDDTRLFILFHFLPPHCPFGLLRGRCPRACA